jgi:hypothetical protein
VYNQKATNVNTPIEALVNNNWLIKASSFFKFRKHLDHGGAYECHTELSMEKFKQKRINKCNSIYWDSK